ncbi:MAG: ABC transporter substrate-binding protein [Nitrospiraceae bacterium]|nr:ABC transporter substrate-binding protein [Nitrospiraceae bacterium]
MMTLGWYNRAKWPAICAVAWLAMSFSPGIAVCGDLRIAVITSQDTPPYQQLATGFREFLKNEGVIADFDHYVLSGNAGKASEVILDIKKQPPRLILTIGTLATQTALREAGDIPVVAGLVSYLDDLRKSKNATGVVLDFPFVTQFEWMHKLMPEIKIIGVLYNRKENQAKIDAAVQAAKKEGLTLLPKEVESPRALPDALESLARSIDLLWGMNDQLVLSPQTAEAILLFSFRSGVPFVGLSSSWVKAGALYALDRDYNDLGAQCGELAIKILRGTNPNTLVIVPPRRILYSLNLKTANHMKLEFSPLIIMNAQQVFP